jgi:ABC-type multidrug transport system fused ATPase/permease subunit
MLRLVGRLLRPYRGWVAIILFATLVETAMSLATPWPLKFILDNVLGGRTPPPWLQDAAAWIPGHSVIRVAAVAAIGSVMIAAISAVASYIDDYYTESVGQWVANDLRMYVHDHLEHLSLAYYDTHQTGTLLSTLIDDIETIQGFASEATLSILVDLLAIVGMLGLMFWLNWDFALIAVAVAPILVLLVARFRQEK